MVFQLQAPGPQAGVCKEALAEWSSRDQELPLELKGPPELTMMMNTIMWLVMVCTVVEWKMQLMMVDDDGDDDDDDDDGDGDGDCDGGGGGGDGDDLMIMMI